MNYQVGFVPPTFQKSATIQPITTNHLRIHYALINPGDKTVLNALTANNYTGELQIHARGPNLKFKKFDPTYFVSPAVNRGAILFAVICWAALIALIHTAQSSEMDLSRRIAGLLTFALVLGIPAAVAIYQGTILAVKRLQRRVEKVERQRTRSE
jgi:hypothetical protein